MNYGLSNQQRRAVRRAMRTPCQVVSQAQFELLGERSLDVSPRGMLLACDVPVALGERVIVSASTAGAQPFWFDAEAEVTRIIYGFRHGDPGYCAGLRFTYLERRDRHELLSRLAGFPPPVPQRSPELRARPREGVRLLLSRLIGSPSDVPRGVFRA